MQQQRPAVARRYGVRAVGALGTPQAGVLVYNPTAQPEISHNEIYGNAGSGIEVTLHRHRVLRARTHASLNPVWPKARREIPLPIA